MRQVQRQPSRFHAQALESQAQTGSAVPLASAGDAEDDAPLTSLLAAWPPPELAALIRQVENMTFRCS